MKQNKLFLVAALLILTSVLSTPVFAVPADEEGENWMSYDNIINELESSSRAKVEVPQDGDPFNQVLLHTGLGLATSYVFLSPEQGPRVFGFLRGFEVNFGIDLFSRNWMAEGTLRSFGNEEMRKNTEVSLKEFDLKLVYQDSISNKLNYRFAGGMAARYLDFTTRGTDSAGTKKYSTPSALFGAGLRAKISKVISVGTDIGYRWALVDDTIDEAAIDAALRLDANF